MFSSDKERLRDDLITVYNSLTTRSRGGGADLFSLGASDRMLGNGFKLHQGKFRVDIRRWSFTKMSVKNWKIYL